MALTRVATWKDAKQGKAVLLVIDGQKLEISHADLATFDTEKKIKDELELQATIGNVQPPAMFVHINRDGSLALATGAAPKVWPEDVPEEEPGPGPGELDRG